LGLCCKGYTHFICRRSPCVIHWDRESEIVMNSDSKAPVQEKETKAGNYFVANYPPFSFWSPDAVPSFEEALRRPSAAGNPLGVYVHIPFCRKRCHFCYFRVYTGAKSQEIRTYVEAAKKELERYDRLPSIRDRKPSFVYFGGGTPSFLSRDQLQDLTDGLRSRLSWDEASEITFECEPGTLNETKLRFIRDLGVTRLSLGVENFNARILEVNGRAHRTDEIHRAYSFAREIDFPQINIDLIAGMMDETDENWQDSVEQAIALAPDSITVYQMEVPFNTTIYKQMQDAGRVTAPVADWETKRRWVTYAFEKFEQSGYRVGSAYTVVKNDQSADFRYRDALWRGADLLGLGVASFGHINGVHYQNQHDMDGYLSALEKGDLPVYRAMVPDEEETLIREFVLQFKLGLIDPEYFLQKFGVNVADKFQAPLLQMRNEGYLEQGDSPLRLTRSGLLEIDRLLHSFFLPRHRNVRYA